MKNMSELGGGKQKREKKSQGYLGYRATVMTNKNNFEFCFQAPFQAQKKKKKLVVSG